MTYNSRTPSCTFWTMRG